MFSSILLGFSLLATTCRHLVAIQDRIRHQGFPRFDQSLRTEMVESALCPVPASSCGWFSVPVVRYSSVQTKNPMRL